jgi:SAM-dependent methyltransferase
VSRYALLLRASANRVFGASTSELAVAELGALAHGVALEMIRGVEPTTLAGVEYLVVELDAPLDAHALALLSNLSSLHALFQLEGDLLRPCPVTPRRVLDEDLVTIQRYVGKTNETFTHLLVNLALAGGAGTFDRLLEGERLRLLDPACGRGTTLHRAALYGMDAIGIERDQRAVEAYDTFFVTWLQQKRLKHRVERATLRKGRDQAAHRLTVTYGRGRAPDEQRQVMVVHDDTVLAADHVRARSVDVLACDLPYGVQHATTARPDQRDRGPARLLEAALPVWRELLRPGAGMALAWNRRTLSKDDLQGLVERAGFQLVPASEGAFRHRVDRAIDRDVVVARRPSS